MIEEIGAQVRHRLRGTFAIEEGDPHSSMWTQENMTGWKRGDWNCTVSAAFELTSTEHEFHLKEILLAKRDDEEIFKREKINRIERGLTTDATR
jgi:hypothetical protein